MIMMSAFAVCTYHVFISLSYMLYIFALANDMEFHPSTMSEMPGGRRSMSPVTHGMDFPRPPSKVAGNAIELPSSCAMPDAIGLFPLPSLTRLTGPVKIILRQGRDYLSCIVEPVAPGPARMGGHRAPECLQLP